jgi:hypothetical protein
MQHETSRSTGWLGIAKIFDDLQMGSFKRLSTVRRYVWLWRSGSNTCPPIFTVDMPPGRTGLCQPSCHGTTYQSQQRIIFVRRLDQRSTVTERRPFASHRREASATDYIIVSFDTMSSRTRSNSQQGSMATNI